MKPVYCFTPEELEEHDNKIAESTANKALEMFWEKLQEKEAPEWVSIPWIVENHYCGITNSQSYNRWRKEILNDPNVPYNSIIRKVPGHRPEINRKRFKEWIKEYKANKTKDVRQRMGVI